MCGHRGACGQIFAIPACFCVCPDINRRYHNPMTAMLTDEQSRRFERDGFLAIDALTTPEDIAQIRSLLDPLFDRFDSLGERAFDLAGPRAPGVAPRSPEVNEAAV